MTACNSRNSVLIFFTNCAFRILDSEAANSASRLPCHQKSLIHHSSVESESLHHFPILRVNISTPLIRQIESQVSPAIPPDTPRQSTRWHQIMFDHCFSRHQICVRLSGSSMRLRSRWCSSGFSWDWNNHGGKTLEKRRIFNSDLPVHWPLSYFVCICHFQITTASNFYIQAAGLHVVDDVLTTEAVMISSKLSNHPEIVELIKTRILGYMTATTYVLLSARRLFLLFIILLLAIWLACWCQRSWKI